MPSEPQFVMCYDRWLTKTAANGADVAMPDECGPPYYVAVGEIAWLHYDENGWTSVCLGGAYGRTFYAPGRPETRWSVVRLERESD